MKRTTLLLSAAFIIIILLLGYLIFQTLSNQRSIQKSKQINNKNFAKIFEDPNKEKLVILWSTTEREVALKMIFMYINNSKKYGWWNDITLVIWGPSAKLLVEDKELQESIKGIIKLGYTVKACKQCSDSYGIAVSNKLTELGVTVKYMTEMTDYIKSGYHILTF